MYNVICISSAISVISLYYEYKAYMLRRRINSHVNQEYYKTQAFFTDNEKTKVHVIRNQTIIIIITIHRYSLYAKHERGPKSRHPDTDQPTDHAQPHCTS